jgi:phospholipase C
MIARPYLLALLGAALCAGCSVATNAVTGSGNLPHALGVPAGRSQVSDHIKHVVVIVQENRSFENFFAGYPGADAPMYGYGKRHGERIQIPLHRITFDGPNLQHLWETGIAQWDGGAMDGFAAFSQNGAYPAYAYVRRDLIAPYWTIARRYVLADHMFPTEFGPSWTAHLTLVAGTDNVRRDLAIADFSSAGYNSCDAKPGARSTTVNAKRHIDFHGGPAPCFTQFRTLASTLDAAGVSWKYYVNKLWQSGIWSAFEAIKEVRRGPDWHRDVIAPETQVLDDIQNGNLASVSWVTPSKIDSDHPGSHSDRGPSWVASIVNAIGESSYWKSTAIVVVWDDWGGWYDNAPPPQLDFRGLAIRVPCLIVSPYAKRGYVSKTRYEYGSILKFIEQAFGLPELGSSEDGYTDARAHSIADSFDFTQQPRAFRPVPSKYSIDQFRAEPPSDDPVDDQ